MSERSPPPQLLVVSGLVGPAAAPLERLHGLPLGAVLDAHVVAHGVGVGEVARAVGDGADGAVARVVRLQVPPRAGRRAEPRAAQRAAQRARRARPYPRFCQRAPRRGICNADTTMLLELS